MTDSKKSERPSAEAAAALGQDLLAQIAHDFSPQAMAAEKAKVTQQSDALIAQLTRDFGHPEQKRQDAAALANQLLAKVSRDFGSIPPPASVTQESDAQLEAAATKDARLTPEELADLDAMTAPTGFWGKLFARLGKKKDP